MKDKILKIAQKAKAASRKLSNISTKIKNNSLMAMADLLEERTDFIVEANSKDIKYAKGKGFLQQ